METKTALSDEGRMMSIRDVMKMWPISRQVLWRLSNAKSEDKRIPSYRIGGKRLYRYDELMWYLDKHKSLPSEFKQRR